MARPHAVSPSAFVSNTSDPWFISNCGGRVCVCVCVCVCVRGSGCITTEQVGDTLSVLGVD